MHADAGYKLQREVQGVVDFNLDEEPSLSGLKESQVDYHIMGVIFAHQYTLKRGLEKFGERAEEATTKELKQIHDMGTYQSMNAIKLTQKGKKWRHYLP